MAITLRGANPHVSTLSPRRQGNASHVRSVGRRWTLGVVLAAALQLPAASASAQAPNAAAAIDAARNARAKTEEAQKKNSDALDPAQASPGSPRSGAGGSQSGQASPAAQPANPSTGPGYSYDPQGRRDPFVSLLGRGGDVPLSTGSRPAGLGGLLINEVTLKGVLKSTKGEFIALLQSPDNRTYIVRAGDKVMDGTVKAITQDAVVFSQDVNDPLSLVKQREVRKTIRPEAR
jgi:Tfp pilus assembly protein PilP